MASEFLTENPIEQYPLKMRNMQALIDISDAELKLYEQIAEQLTGIENNGFFDTADVDSIKRYEEMIGIISVPDEIIDFRRARLKNRFNLNKKFSMRLYCEKLNDLIGAGRWKATLNADRTLLTIEAAATDAAWTNELMETINLIKPVRLNAVIKPNIITNIKIKTRSSRQFVRYGFIAGISHVGDKIGGVYATEMEVEGKLMATKYELSKTAEFIKEQIAAVTINDNVTITNFATKETTNNNITLEYVIPDSVEKVDNIKLLDNEGYIILEQNVNVATSDNVLMKHYITIDNEEE